MGGSIEAIVELVFGSIALLIYGEKPNYPVWPRRILRWTTLGGHAGLSLLLVLPEPPVQPRWWWFLLLMPPAFVMLYGEIESTNGKKRLGLLCLAMMALVIILGIEDWL